MEYPLTMHDAAGLVSDAVFADALPCRTRLVGDGCRLTVGAAHQGPVAGIDSGAMSAVIMIGAFDGVHVGHRSLVRAARADATSRGVPCLAVTFDPDPADVVAGPSPGSLLLPPAQRARALIAAGVDAVITIPFTPWLAGLSHQRFFEDVIAPIVRVEGVHVGSDFRLGRSRAATLASLVEYGLAHGFSVTGHDLVCVQGLPVTATRVRDAVRAGDVELAHALLGRLHVVHGVVEHGRGEGASLGFPTANVRFEATTCLPPAGVYGAYAIIEDDRGHYASKVGCAGAGGVLACAAAVNVGTPPTFASVADASFLEAHLVGFSGDLYGHVLAIAFCCRIRKVHNFDSVQKLEQVVYQNIDWVRDNLGSGCFCIGP